MNALILSCPLNNQYLVSNIMYRATISSNKTTKQYLDKQEILSNYVIEITNHHSKILTKDIQQNWQTTF